MVVREVVGDVDGQHFQLGVEDVAASLLRQAARRCRGQLAAERELSIPGTPAALVAVELGRLSRRLRRARAPNSVSRAPARDAARGGPRCRRYWRARTTGGRPPAGPLHLPRCPSLRTARPHPHPVFSTRYVVTQSWTSTGRNRHSVAAGIGETPRGDGPQRPEKVRPGTGRLNAAVPGRPVPVRGGSRSSFTGSSPRTTANSKR